jgi:hypothetical protein
MCDNNNTIFINNTKSVIQFALTYRFVVNKTNVSVPYFETFCIFFDSSKVKKEQLINLLHLLGDYVLFTSNGDKVIAISSGFTIAKSPSPRPPLEKPAYYTVENGVNPLELISKGARVKNAVSYNHQYAEDEQMAAGLWTSVPSSKSTSVLPNLKSGVFYNCRMEVLGVKGQVVYSDIIRIRVI